MTRRSILNVSVVTVLGHILTYGAFNASFGHEPENWTKMSGNH